MILKKQNVSMFLDLSAAFDCVEHSVLVDNMTVYGFSGSSTGLIRIYLMGRSKMVTVGNRNSTYWSIKCGMPYGSILGLIL